MTRVSLGKRNIITLCQLGRVSRHIAQHGGIPSSHRIVRCAGTVSWCVVMVKQQHDFLPQLFFRLLQSTKHLVLIDCLALTEGENFFDTRIGDFFFLHTWYMFFFLLLTQFDESAPCFGIHVAKQGTSQRTSKTPAALKGQCVKKVVDFSLFFTSKTHY